MTTNADPWKEAERLRARLHDQLGGPWKAATPVELKYVNIQMQHAAPFIITALYTLAYGVVCYFTGSRRIANVVFGIGAFALLRAVLPVKSARFVAHIPKDRTR